MAIFHPPAVSIDRFTGGFKSTSDYTDLADTETNDSKNVIYTPGGDLEQKLGSLKLYNTALTNSDSTARPITGHYYYKKLGASTDQHLVACGGQLWNYTSATATVIASGLTDSSAVFWSFIQIQDPRSASDDVVIGTNGVDAIKLWNGSASAINLSGLTSASGVPVAKYVLQHKNRIYAANIVDTTQIDSPVQVKRTGFGSDGAPDPHIFRESFFVGGSSRDGQINAQKILNDDIIYYTDNSVWRFSPGLGDVNDLRKITGALGLLAPGSLVDTGNYHIFLSQRGVFAFDGNTLLHLSEKIDDLLLKDTNRTRLSLAKGIFDQKNSQYKLWVPSQGSNRNDLELIYDVRPEMKFWQPPGKGRSANVVSTFLDSTFEDRIIYGDYFGYLYEDGVGKNYGIESGYNDTVGSATTLTITADSATFSTAGDGLSGLICEIVSGVGVGQSRYISSNTSAVLTLESVWAQVPDTTSKYTVGAINSYWKSKDYDFGGHDIVKLFKEAVIRTREEGNFNLDLLYAVDFRPTQLNTLVSILLSTGGMIWGLAVWGASTWGGSKSMKKKIFFRSTSSQPSNGTHINMRFSNTQSNQTWLLTGFDMTFKAIGKR